MKVNLLPWRDIDRKQKITRFSRIFLLSLICGGCMWIITYIVIDKKLQQIKQENQQILETIARKTASLLQSGRTKDQQLQQVKFFQQAQLIKLKQQQILLFFSTLPKLMHGTLYLVNIKKEDGQIIIVGVANEYVDISRLFFAIQQQMQQVQLTMAQKINNQISFVMNALCR